jgi:hypothetical protein
MVSNGFWHIVSVVKEQDLPVQQKGTSTAQGEYDDRANKSTGDYRFPQESTGGKIVKNTGVFHSIPA